ncbi:response regulator [Roseivirga sp.]|uniref:response regulator n=1 Tax=Roseivirga sp. TaxID=1964215 RepID=UPI003B8C5790
MKKILIVEDNYMMRVFLLNYLGKTYDVAAVETPSEALALASQGQQFDLVLSDYQKEHSEESEVLNALNLQLAWSSTSLFILTDEDKSDQRINALNTGAKDTLSKPFNPKELNLRINSLLDQSNLFTGLRTVA